MKWLRKIIRKILGIRSPSTDLMDNEAIKRGLDEPSR